MSALRYVIGIDPGPTSSGLVVCSVRGPADADMTVNQTYKAASWKDVRAELENRGIDIRTGHCLVALERVQPGASSWSLTKTSEVCGRVMQMHDVIGCGMSQVVPLQLLTRSTVLSLLRVSARGSQRDKMVRARLIEMFGGDRATAIGTVKRPGPLHGVASHAWAALAVAVAARVHLREQRELHLAHERAQ